MKRLQFLFWVICLSGCMEKSVSDDYRPEFTAKQLTDTLEIIGGDSLRLRSFCESWNRRVLPNTQAFIEQNDTLKALYVVYDAFRNADSIAPWDRWDWHKLTGATNLFLPLSSKMFYAVAPDSARFEKINSMDSLFCFRPPLPRFSARLLYVTPELAEALNTYLGYNDPLVKNRRFFSTEDTLSYHRWEYYEIRRNQIGKVIALGKAFRISGILISPDLQTARVRLSFSGGESEAIFKNENGIWRFQEKRVIWIE